MKRIDTVVIGSGQAGLALSHELTAAGHDHVVLERHELGSRWRRQAWDSLRLLTPNWMNVLPGSTMTGPNPDGFATATGFAEHLGRYARSFGAPVETGAAVDSVSRQGDSFEVATSAGTWRAGNVVVATGWCDRPATPALAAQLTVGQLVPAAYRSAGDLEPGGVLVVGASATGAQLADELRTAGREVTLAVGRHTRLPRTYRGMDIFWWLDQMGALARTIDTMPDDGHARQEPSLQLVGRPDKATLDLPRLQAAGVRLTGRMIGASGSRVAFDADLGAMLADTDRRLTRLLRRIDTFIDASGLGPEVLAPEPFPVVKPVEPVTSLDLRGAGITTVIWATGYRRDYPWLQVPVLGGDGEIRHTRGITPVPGLYVLGQRFQHRRSSNFIGGVGADATFIARRIIAAAAHPSNEEPSRAQR